ncbi:hypothetical protein Tco_1109178 [Tanacetum coccineum]
MLASPEQTATGKDLSNPFMVVMTYQKSYSIQHTMINVLSVEVVFSSPWIITFSRSVKEVFMTRDFQGSQTDCVQDITWKIMSRRLKTCIDAEQGVQPSRNLKSSK